MTEAAGRSGRRTRTRAASCFPALVLAAAALLPAPAGALQVIGLTVEKSVTGAPPFPYALGPGDTVKIGDLIRITVTLMNDSGLLGNMCADAGPPCFPPPYTCPPAPGMGTCVNVDPFDCGAQNNGMMDQGVPGMWPGQWWLWPVLGKCPNELYPKWNGSPVSFYAAEPVTGFHYNGSYLNSVEIYDPGLFTWTPGAPMPTARAKFGAAVDSGKLYAVGGHGDTGYLAVNEAYDIAGNAWEPVPRAPMTTPREGLGVAAVGGIIYAIGGYNSTDGVLATVEAYDPLSDSWSTKAPMPTPRYGLAVVACNGKIYAIGGFTGGAWGVLNTVEEYDPVGNSWAPMNPMNYARGDFAASEVGGLIYVGGGYDWFGSRWDTEVFDPLANVWTPMGGTMSGGTSRLAGAAVGGIVYGVGGSNDFFAPSVYWFPCGYAITGLPNNQTYDPVFDMWGGPADLATAREWPAAASDGTYVYALGGYSGFQFMNMGAQNNVTAASWTFAARTSWCGLDFSVMGMNSDDGNWCSGVSQEGSFFDCSIPPAGGYNGDGTLQHIFTDMWGGTLCIVSPLVSHTQTAIVGAGTRPPNVAYIGDILLVETSLTNTGAKTQINAFEACAQYNPNSTTKGAQICAAPWELPGACTGIATVQAGSPVLPANVDFNENKMFQWTFSLAGKGAFSGFLPCSVGSWGAGTVFCDVSIQGSTSTSPPVNVVAAPLAITATGWVDPDGPSGPLPPVPMRDAGLGAEYYYFMGAETVQAKFIYTNTDTIYSFDIEPALSLSSFQADMMLIVGPVPAGPLMLAPGQSATVTWDFTRTPAGGAFSQCTAPGPYGLDFTTAVRGVAATQSVRITDTPFRPLDPCATGCPAGSRNLTFDMPGTADQFSVFTVNLYARNSDDRPFVLDPAAAFFLGIQPITGAASIAVPPPPPPMTWLAGQTNTITWQISGDLAGQVCFQAGIDYSAAVPPCLTACRDAIPYCDNAAPYPYGCMFVKVPGAFSTTYFTAGPSASCDDPGQVVVLRLLLTNTSTLYCAVATSFCDSNSPDAFPIGYANPYSKAPLPYPAVASPFPALPITIPQSTSFYSSSKLVTWYMDAACPPTPGGQISFGCFSKTNMLVNGYTIDCVSKAVKNPADGASFGGSAPVVTITQPGYLSCSIWTDNYEYSVGQLVTVYFSVSNEGGDGLTTFGVGSWPRLFKGALVGPALGPVPAAPAAYPGSGVCVSTPPFASNQTFVWQFVATSKGEVTFTATAEGWDAGCGTWKSTSCTTPVVRIASSAELNCAHPAITPIVTMSVSCSGCPRVSGCDPATGLGCLNVSMDLSNFGDVAVRDVVVSPSNAYPALQACVPAGSCTAGSAALVFRIDPPTPLNRLASGTATWRYAPTGLGCLRVHVEAFGNDNATGTTLYCDGWTDCASIKARRPMELTLVSVPAQVAPGQEFTVQVRVCNPGDTPAGLQSGEPAFQFYLAATGAKVTDQYDVIPPPPVVLASGECRTIDVTAIAHRNAEPGAVEIRVAQGTQFVALDAATGLPFPAIDTGGPLTTRVVNLQNRLVVVGDNQTRILKQPVLLGYQIADAGRGGGRTSLRIYTLTGELVRVLVDKPAVVEENTVPWDGRNDGGQICASGIYLGRLESPTFSKVAKVAILK